MNPILKAILEKADSDIINYLINLPSVDLEKNSSTIELIYILQQMRDLRML